MESHKVLMESNFRTTALLQIEQPTHPPTTLSLIIHQKIFQPTNIYIFFPLLRRLTSLAYARKLAGFNNIIIP